MDPTGYLYPDTTRLRSVPPQTTKSLTLRLWAQKVSKMKEVKHGRILGSSDNSTGQIYRTPRRLRHHRKNHLLNLCELLLLFLLLWSWFLRMNADHRASVKLPLVLTLIWAHLIFSFIQGLKLHNSLFSGVWCLHRSASESWSHGTLHKAYFVVLWREKPFVAILQTIYKHVQRVWQK